MTERELKADAPSLGVIVVVRGSVVDMRSDAQLPPIYTVLRAGTEKQIVIEVLAQLDTRHAQGIALTPTRDLARGMAIEDSGGPLQAPVGKGVLSHMLTYSATLSTAKQPWSTSRGARCIGRRRSREVRPSRRFSRRASRSSTCSCRVRR